MFSLHLYLWMNTIKCSIKPRRHSGAAASASSKEVVGSIPGQRPFCVESVSSPGLLQVPSRFSGLLPHSKKMKSKPCSRNTSWFVWEDGKAMFVMDKLQSPNSFCLWWLTPALGGNLAAFYIKRAPVAPSAGHCSRLRAPGCRSSASDY